MAMFVALLVCVAINVCAQQVNTSPSAESEQRVALDAQPVALDSLGRTAISGQLLTRALDGTPDMPVSNARFIIENKSAIFYTYVSGTVTFYDERGVRCGEGEFALSSLAPNEQAETDAPGLRVTCSPRMWRLVANNLLTRTNETVRPTAEAATQPAPTAETPSATVPTPLEIVVDDKVYSAPMGSTLTVPVKKRRIKITVRAPQQ
jgi:hypothetical protein